MGMPAAGIPALVMSARACMRCANAKSISALLSDSVKISLQ